MPVCPWLEIEIPNMSCFPPVLPCLFLPGFNHIVSRIPFAGRRICFAFVLIISCFSKDGIAQSRRSLRFESFGVNEGLSQGNVTCMMQDRQRMLWFGTWDGVNLYDGFRNHSFHNPSYHSENIRGIVINNIVELDWDRVAICSYTGLSIFQRSIQRFCHYADEPAFLNCRLLRRSGDLLILSSGSQLRIFNLRSKQFQAYSGKEAGVWKSALTNRKNGVNRSEFLFTRAFDLMQKQPWAFSSLVETWSRLTVNDLIWQPDQSRLFLGCEEGLLLVDFRNGSRQIFLEGTSIKSLAQARNQLFIGSQLAGLFVMDLPELNISGHYLHDEKNRHSIAGNYIRNLFVDDDQNIWLSVLGGGLSYASLQPKPARTLFSSFSLPAGSNQDNYIQSLAEDSAGRLWMYSVSGNLNVLDAEYHVIRTFTPDQIDPVALPVSVQQIFVDPDGTVFLLSNKGLYQETAPFRFARILQTDSSEGASYFQTMIRIAPGEYLLGTRSGVFFFDQKAATLRRISHPALDKEVIHFLFQDEKGRIYVNRFFKGVKLFSFNGQNLHEIADIPTEANLKSAVETKTGILFASSKGVLQLDPRNPGLNPLSELSAIPDQTIYCLLKDPDEPSVFWSSSNRGIYQIHLKTGQYQRFGLNEGLNSLEFNTSSFAVRKNGDFVFGSTDGLTVLDPSQPVFPRGKHNLILEDLALHQIPDSVRQEYSTKGSGVYTVPFENNGFSCRLVQVLYPNVESPIRYRLEGHDDDWIEATNPVQVMYSNLPEGDYQFVSQVYKPQTGWVTQKWFSLTIQPPWFRTIWAYIAYVSVLVSLVLLSIRIYIQQRLQQERDQLVKREVLLQERSRIILDLHDDVGSSLSSIQLLSQVAERVMDEQPDKTRQFLRKIFENSESTIQNLGDIIWAMKTDLGEDAMEVRIRTYCVDLLQPKDMEAELHFETPMAEVFDDAAKRKNALLLIKEALHNAAKYSGATVISILFSRTEEAYRLVIEDNGRGFDPVLAKKGNGLGTMKVRAENMGGRLVFETSPGMGTRIEWVKELG